MNAAGGHDPASLRRLHKARGFLLDMDGTIVIGDRLNHAVVPLPGALELVSHLRAAGVPVAVLTNGTARPPRAYAETLRRLGFDLPDEVVLTPASSAVEVCLRRGHRRVMLLAGEGVAGPLREAGIEVLAPEGRPPVEAVVVGWFREVRFEHLEAACNAVWDGAELYSASQSHFFASAEGRSIGTSRAISAVIRDLTGRRPTVVGKPSLDALRTAARRLGLPAGDLAVVGDDPELEVPMAHRGRALAVAVRSGLGDDAAFGTASMRRPHLVLEGAAELLELYRSGR